MTQGPSLCVDAPLRSRGRPCWIRVHDLASEQVFPGQLDPQVASNVNFDELTQPHVIRRREPLDQFLLGSVREVNDPPPVKGSEFTTINRVLNVKERLSFAGSKPIPVAIGEFGRSYESGPLPCRVEEDLFQDQPAL